jgi:paraquat-inducible protein A
MIRLIACETCGLVQEVDAEVDVASEGKVVKCCRCNFQIFHRRIHSRRRTLALSIAAGLLYFPSNLYPIVTAQYQGHSLKTTIFQGIASLWQQGNYFISSLVFCTSILTPALKIIGLIFITVTLDWNEWRKARTWIYRIIRIIDPWNMLEVFLLSICVSMVEIGEVATIHPGRGVFSFAAVVVLTLMATLSFDSRLLWDSAEDKMRYE